MTKQIIFCGPEQSLSNDDAVTIADYSFENINYNSMAIQKIFFSNDQQRVQTSQIVEWLAFIISAEFVASRVQQQGRSIILESSNDLVDIVLNIISNNTCDVEIKMQIQFWCFVAANLLLRVFVLFREQIKRSIRVMTNTINPNLIEQYTIPSEILEIKSRNMNIEAQASSLTQVFKAYTDQNQKLTHLYETAKLRNKELSSLSCKFMKDIRFLRQYCLSLEKELIRSGYFKVDHQSKLARKETAESIFQSYEDSNLQPTPPSDQTTLDMQLFHLRNRNLNLQNENKSLRKHISNRLHESINKKTQPSESELRKKSCEALEERIRKLQREVRDLRQINQRLQFQKAKRAATNYILKDQGEIFNNVHNIISQYKEKLSGLTHEKRDIEKKYKLLKEKINQFDHNKQYRLIDLYTEKIEMLQKLTEKQQLQIENTINLYECELKKIEDRRKEEIEMYESLKLNLQSQNLKLCIDLQKSLNKNDSITLLLLQEKNKNEILHQSLQKYEQSRKAKPKMKAQSRNCQIAHGVMHYNKELEHPFRERIYFNQNIASRIIYPPKGNEENSNLSNYQYDSEMMEKHTIVEKLQQSKSIKGGEQSMPKKFIRDKITISYRQPDNYASSVMKSSLQKNKTTVIQKAKNGYNSIIEYKKRFVNNKPESSFNQ